VKKVLIVEDSQPVRQHICEVLTEAGFAAIEAVDGMDGLEQLRTAPEASVAPGGPAVLDGAGTGFHLVLCDVNMPRMGGIDLLEEVKRAGMVTPFVMLTSEAVPTLMRRARAAGAAAWVVKPVKPALLVSTIIKLIGPPS
jgi:two-component system chemotaxis response regulator CheY